MHISGHYSGYITQYDRTTRHPDPVEEMPVVSHPAASDLPPSPHHPSSIVSPHTPDLPVSTVSMVDLNTAQHILYSIVFINTVTVLCQDDGFNNDTNSVIPNNQDLDGDNVNSDSSSLLYSFSQFNIPVNKTMSSSSGTGSNMSDYDKISLVMANPAQFLVLQFASTVIVTNVQVSILPVGCPVHYCYYLMSLDNQLH